MRTLIEGLPKLEIRDGMVLIDLADVGFCTSIRNFRSGMRLGAKLLAEHDASGAVVPMPKRADHAAS